MSVQLRDATPSLQQESLQHEQVDHQHELNGTSDSETDTDDDDDDEDEEPPMLKYTRITSQLPSSFFDKDPVSTCNFGERYFVFATHSGMIHITTPELKAIRTFRAHRASVLDIYQDGTYFATGSMDGTVVIGSIKDEKDIVAYDFQRPVHSVVLDPNYNKSRSFVSGGMAGKVIYSSRNWLGKRSDVILEQDNGPVVSIKLIDDLILWMNDNGITISHLTTRQIITVIPKPKDSPRSDLYWPRVSFPETDRILIAWGNYVWSLRVSIKAKNSSPTNSILPTTASISFRAVQEKKVEVERIFKLDSLISGISSYKDDLLMLLTYEPPQINDDGKRVYVNPELKLINSQTGNVEFEEELGLRNVENLGLNDYLLGRHIESKPAYYVISAKDAVMAREFQLDDRLQWFLDREKYFDAWEISEHLEPPLKRLNYGVQHIDNLIQQEDWTQASSFLPRLLHLEDTETSEAQSTIVTKDLHESLVTEVIKQWQEWAIIFIKSGHIKEITEVLPKNVHLTKEVYTSILEYWIPIDLTRFQALVEEWEADLYDIKKIESELEGLVESDSKNRPQLRRNLCILYEKSYEPQKAVPHLMSLRDPNIVQFLSSNHILTNFKDQLDQIIKLRFKDDKQIEELPVDDIKSRLSDVIDVLVESYHELAPKEVLQIFTDRHLSFINYFYLEKLALVDEFLVEPFGNDRIHLYCLYDRTLLLPFLKNHNNYDIDEAIEICQSHELTEELVYLLGKIGQNERALGLIINKLDDPELAISFAKEQNDKQCWDILLKSSMEKRNFIKALIEFSDEHTQQYYDPIVVLQNMSKKINIVGLNKSIIKFHNNNDLTLLINQIILKSIYKQSQEVSGRYRLELLKGYEIDIGGKTVDNLQQSIEHWLSTTA